MPQTHIRVGWVGGGWGVGGGAGGSGRRVSVMTIRAATFADERQIARICLLTGADGGDATGQFTDDAVLADVFAVPYLRGPGCVALVWDVEGQARGYVLAAADTSAFQAWFSNEWWPSRRHREAHTPGDAWLLPSAADPKRCLNAAVADYPAHLHIDLLPDQQGKGAGRRLIDAMCEALRGSGVPGVHLVASAANRGALAFYPRVGFNEIARDATTVTFARDLV